MFFSKSARASSTSDEDFLEGEEGIGWAGAPAAISDASARHAAGLPIPFLSNSLVVPLIFTSAGLRVGRGFCGRGLYDAVSPLREAGDRDGELAADRRFAEQRLNGGNLRDVLSAPRAEVRLEVGEIPQQIGASERDDDDGLAEREELQDRGSPRLRYGDLSQPRTRPHEERDEDHVRILRGFDGGSRLLRRRARVERYRLHGRGARLDLRPERARRAVPRRLVGDDERKQFRALLERQRVGLLAHERERAPRDLGIERLNGRRVDDLREAAHERDARLVQLQLLLTVENPRHRLVEASLGDPA